MLDRCRRPSLRLALRAGPSPREQPQTQGPGVAPLPGHRPGPIPAYSAPLAQPRGLAPGGIPWLFAADAGGSLALSTARCSSRPVCLRHVWVEIVLNSKTASTKETCISNYRPPVAAGQAQARRLWETCLHKPEFPGTQSSPRPPRPSPGKGLVRTALPRPRVSPPCEGQRMWCRGMRQGLLGTSAPSPPCLPAAAPRLLPGGALLATGSELPEAGPGSGWPWLWLWPWP